MTTTHRYSGLSDLVSRLFRGHSAPHSRARFRTFMFIEAVSFLVATLAHGGILAEGREHMMIRVGDTFMGLVLAAGVIASWAVPCHARGIAFGTQAFAFFGTVVGLLLIALGIGPHSLPGLTFNAVALLLLSLGLFFAARAP